MLRGFILFPFFSLLTFQIALAQGNLLDQGLKLFTGDTGAEQSGAKLSSEKVSSGLKEALRIGSGKVVDQISQVGGYTADPAIHIPLPQNLQTVKTALQAIGQGAMADELEAKLNQGAEKAALEAQSLFVEAISAMTMEDVQRIYEGEKDAATRYFQQKMTPLLTEKFKPVVSESLVDVGALKTYNAMISDYKTIPFVPDITDDLTDYTVGKALEGLFYYLAKEEEQIRQNPAARTTELLQEVFGQN
ncbi:DUF4197 domain-containing protein [Kiloniella laminariae]|uniref:DUF4197 domain-containing protein n=1 Tax=Kiloniella laminariae TaxID=454162 RepID=A0ABT4LLK1_9PROT|nr:DUF4197 domain-containing protein [Kiloniella laminariae]MCZ4281992.1 DUF4197 domain-containing protein [Kiloniella laminariae]